MSTNDLTQALTEESVFRTTLIASMDVPDGLGVPFAWKNPTKAAMAPVDDPALTGRLLDLLQYHPNTTLSRLMTCLILLRSGWLMISH